VNERLLGYSEIVTAFGTYTEQQREDMRSELGIGERNEPNGFAGIDSEGVLPAIVTVRRGTEAEIDAIVLNDGELAIVDVDGSPAFLRMGDGETLGGVQQGLTGEVLGLYDEDEDQFVNLQITANVASGWSGIEIQVASLTCNSLVIVNDAVAKTFSTILSDLINASASQNNWNPGQSNSILRVNATSAINITGTTYLQGKWINTGTSNITIVHESGSSTAGNRFLTNTGSNLVLTPNNALEIVTDGSFNRRRCWLL
jgi:hypothetical protein